MTTTMLPLMIDAPACDLPRPGAGLDEALVVQLTAEDGGTYILPLSLAAAQALVNMLAGAEDASAPPAPPREPTLRVRVASSAG
ncbi:MAG: hypothetical protein U1E62_00705 [Alsobacter sp.]